MSQVFSHSHFRVNFMGSVKLPLAMPAISRTNNPRRAAFITGFPVQARSRQVYSLHGARQAWGGAALSRGGYRRDQGRGGRGERQRQDPFARPGADVEPGFGRGGAGGGAGRSGGGARRCTEPFGGGRRDQQPGAARPETGRRAQPSQPALLAQLSARRPGGEGAEAAGKA